MNSNGHQEGEVQSPKLTAAILVFIRKVTIPPSSPYGHTGMLALQRRVIIATTMSFLERASELLASERILLTTHLRSLIILGAQHLLLVREPV